jgi:NAD(P)H dehydrogenase (quinone)
MTARFTVAVLGASGQTGRRVLAALSDRGVATRAVTRQSAAPDFATEAAKADLTDPGSVRAALEGAAAVYIVVPAFHPGEDRLVAATATAAVEAGVGRIVLHSVLHPYTPRMPHHMRKAAAEDSVRRAGVPWTICSRRCTSRPLSACCGQGPRRSRWRGRRRLR